MAIAGWLLDKSAAARTADPQFAELIAELAGSLHVCPVSELEQLYSARSARDYEQLREDLHASLTVVAAPPDLLDRALGLQRALAHRHLTWHRTSISELLIAETALYHGLGVVHVVGDFRRIAEVRPLVVKRLMPAVRPER